MKNQVSSFRRRLLQFSITTIISRSILCCYFSCWKLISIHLDWLIKTWTKRYNWMIFDDDTVQLTTFRPLSSAAKASTPGSNTTSPASNSVAPKPKSRTLDSSDTSDYENLSSCTSGRYATLPPQSQFGGGGGGGGGANVGTGPLYRDHYATTGNAASGTAAGVLFRPASGPASFGLGASGIGGHFAPVEPPTAQHTLSLHRPVKRSQWLNHNGRPSDVLARVFQANQDWLESNDSHQDGVNSIATIKDAHRTCQQRTR